MRLTLGIVCASLPCVALAHSGPMQVARLASANQIGVMEYCHGKGWADQAAGQLAK